MNERILIVGYMPPPYHGVVRMTEILRNSKFLNDKFDIDIFYIQAVDNAENRGKFAIKNIVFNLENILSFFRQCFLKKYDILYLSIAQNNLGFLRDSLFVLIAKIFGIKVLAQYHAGDFTKNYFIKNIFFKFYIKYIYRKKVDMLIVLAEKIKEQFVNFLAPEKIFVVANFVEDIFIPEKCPQKDFNKKNIKILFIGYISKAKGAVDLVKAAKIVIDKLEGYDIEFFLAGDFINIERNVVYIDNPNGGYNEIIDYISKNSLQKNIKLLGYIDEKLKNKFLKESDLFVLPSYSEGFPVSVLEAMSYALPMVLTRVGALDEIFKDKENCLFSKIGDNRDLADQIIDIITNFELREKISINNYTLVKNVFNLTNYEIKIKNLFETLGAYK